MLAVVRVPGVVGGGQPFDDGKWSGQEYIFVGELLVVIVLSLCFESATDGLQECFEKMGSRGKSMRMMMDCVTKEIMILGFIGLLVYVGTKTEVALAIARKLYPHGMVSESEDPLAETFETVHMMIFCVMMCFIAQASTLMYKCYSEAGKWKHWEDMRAHSGLAHDDTIVKMLCREGYLKAKGKDAEDIESEQKLEDMEGSEDDDFGVDDHEDRVQKFKDFINSKYSVVHNITSVTNPFSRLFAQGGVVGVIEWRAIRHDFMFPAHVDENKPTEFDSEIKSLYLPKEPHFFRFHEYLTQKMGDDFVDLMELDLSTWVVASVLSLMLPMILDAGEEWYVTIAACSSWVIVFLFLGFTVHIFHVYIRLSIGLPQDPVDTLLALRGTDTMGLHQKVRHTVAQATKSQTSNRIAKRTPRSRLLNLEQGLSDVDSRLRAISEALSAKGSSLAVPLLPADTLGVANGASRSGDPSPQKRRESSFRHRFEVKTITQENLAVYHRPWYVQMLDRVLAACGGETSSADFHPTYQDQLFLFHEHGPWIMKKAFELLIFLQSICMASFIVIWLTLEDWDLYQYIVFILGVAAPIFNLSWLVPRLVSKFALVTSIDFKKDISLCESIMSENKKKQIIDILRLLKIARMEGKIQRLSKSRLSEEDKMKHLAEYNQSFSFTKKMQFEKLFHVFDADSSGSISLREMKKALVSLGIPEDSTLVTGAGKIMTLIDVNQSDTIELEEFQVLLAMAFLKASPEELKADIEALFEKFDDDGSGFLSIEELAVAFEDLGVTLSTDDMAELVYEVFLRFKQQMNMAQFGEFMEGLENKFSE